MQSKENMGLRPFTEDDAELIRQKQYPCESLDSIHEMIREWQCGEYDGKRFEMLALTAGEAVVGSVSLYERSKSAASIGIEIFEGERRKGYASAAMKLLLERAAASGYKLILNQVLTGNAPSKALHEKLGFETDGYIYKNAKGREVLLYTRCI